MTTNQTSTISLSTAFSEAWKGFKGWWIPLCIVSAILLFCQEWLPELVIREFPESKIIDSYKEEFETFSKKVESGEDAFKAASYFLDRINHLNAKPELYILIKKIFIFIGILILFLCVLRAIMLLMSKFSVFKGSKKIKENSHKPIIMVPSYLLLAIIKVIPFMFFILPGFYFYVKLYFTGFIITEKSVNPFTAMGKSWKMTNGIFWETCAIFMFTLIVDCIFFISICISFITIIGTIPWISFKNTLRASLYKQALEIYNRKLIPSEEPTISGP